MRTKRKSAADTWAEIQALKELTIRELEEARIAKDKAQEEYKVAHHWKRCKSKELVNENRRLRDNEALNIVLMINELIASKGIKINLRIPVGRYDKYTAGLITIEDIAIPTTPAAPVKPKQIDRTGINSFQEFIEKCRRNW